MAAGVGLWDTARRHLPHSPARPPRRPRPAAPAPSGAALFNMAFRTNEPVPHIYDPGHRQHDRRGPRDRRAGRLLLARAPPGRRARPSGDVSAVQRRSVDFAKLAAQGTDDDSARPADRALRPDLRQPLRLRPGHRLQRRVPDRHGVSECTGRYAGPAAALRALRPRTSRVPAQGLRARGQHARPVGELQRVPRQPRGRAARRARHADRSSPRREARGPDGSYQSYAEADVFEMWADVARHYRLDPALTDVTGYSMGGGGHLPPRQRAGPDLFARAFPIVGPPTSADVVHRRCATSR